MGDMMSRLADCRFPPKDVFVLVTDTTSRDYDLSALAWNGVEYSVNNGDFVYVTIYAETADVYFAIDSTAARTVDQTVGVAAGGTPAFATTSCWIIPAGQERDYAIKRSAFRYLHVKASAAGKLRMTASSEHTSAHR